MSESKIQISVIVPLYNEKKNVPILYHSIQKVLRDLSKTYEMVFIDDGSNDGTRTILKDLADKDPMLKVILFRKNFGQSAAMATSSF